MVNGSNNQNNKNVVLLMTIILSVVSLFLLGLIFYLISSPKIVLLQSVTHLTDNTREVIIESNNNYLNKMFRNEQIKDMLDKHNFSFQYISLLEDVEVSDYKKVTDSFYGFLKKEINKDTFDKTKEKITLGNKDKKVTKLSYKVTKDKLNSILTNTINEILADKELLDSLSNVYGYNFKNNLIFDKSNLNKVNYDYFYYNIYYYGFNNIVLYEIEISDYCIRLYNYDDSERMVILENNKIIYTLNIKG